LRQPDRPVGGPGKQTVRILPVRLRRTIAVLLLITTSARADPVLDILARVYPQHLAGHDAVALIWKDGTRMPVDDGLGPKSFDQLLQTPDIRDQFAITYRLGSVFETPAINQDPGRIRNEAFFLKMYGDCRNGDVTGHLKAVPWPIGNSVLMTEINGVADALAAVSRELATLPADMTKFLAPNGGTYACRTIAGTDRLSLHAFGAAIDINPRFGDYWRWQRFAEGELVWRNRIPLRIVDLFERHGFIWGGKWYHFDTLHFEYRPELIAFSELDQLHK